MFGIKVNTKLLPLKMCYFLIFACLTFMDAFLPTKVSQLGYSMTTYDAAMKFMLVISMVVVPLSGVIVDKFRIKKKLFLMSIFGIGVVSILFLFVPKAPLDLAKIELKCDAQTTTMTVVNENNNLQTTSNLFTYSTVVNHTRGDELITCKLNCQYAELCSAGFEINNLQTQSDLSYVWMKTTNESQNKFNQIDLALIPKDLKQTEHLNAISYVFQVLSVQINGTQIRTPICQCHLKTFCHIASCSNDKIMEVATVTTYRGNVLDLYQFWIFLGLLATYWSCDLISVALINPICLDTLGDKSEEDFGRQKCWSSIGWGVSALFVGLFVYLDKNDIYYSPVFYCGALIMALNLGVVKTIKVVETSKSEGRWKNMGGLFTKYYMIRFCIWSIFNTLFHTIVTNYLFGYLHDLDSANNGYSQREWPKTLHYLAQVIQCFGSEIPFFFWSGWIIRKIGYGNCMAVVMGSMAIRMYLYTVIWNPTWVIAIELLNGVTYALGYSVKMSYAKKVAPPDTLNTIIIGFIGFFDFIGDSIGSLLGRYLFYTYSGVWSFRFFSYIAVFVCFLIIVTNRFDLTKDLTFGGVVAVSMTENNQDDSGDIEIPLNDF